MRLVATLVLAALFAVPAFAAGGERHAPTRPGTTGFRATVAARILTGSAPDHMGAALPSLGATTMGGAFVGRDGRLYVWDAEWANVKIVAFEPDGRTRVSVTPRWPNPGDPLHVLGGDADSTGRVFLACGPIGDRTGCSVLTWQPGGRDWQRWELPHSGGVAGAGGLDFHAGGRARSLADGRAVLLPWGTPDATRGLLLWRSGGGLAPTDPLELVDAPELAWPRTDLAGHRVLHDGAADLAIADSSGRALASMAVPVWPQWKRVLVDGELYEPQGTVLALQTTSRGLVIRRLVPEIAGVPIVPIVPNAPGAAPVRRVKPPRQRRHESSSITG